MSRQNPCLDIVLLDLKEIGRLAFADDVFFVEDLEFATREIKTLKEINDSVGMQISFAEKTVQTFW